MTSKSTGQIIGTVAGAVIGAFTGGAGYVALGASIGGMVGGLIDPVKTKTSGPRLTDLSQQVTGYGNPLPRAYGQIATYGTVFWIENNKLNEVSNTTKSGGKGGGGNKNTAYTYDATFAVSLADCGANFDAIAGISRIWVTGKLVFDGLASSTAAILQSDDFQPTFSLYRGEINQAPDPRIQADLGIANTPAWRGMAYLVLYNFPLEDFGNTLMGAQVKIELITTDLTYGWQTKLLRDQDMPVDFSADKAYITSIDNGVVSVNTYSSSDYYLFDIATGNFIGKRSGEAMAEPVGFAQGVDPVMVMGHAANGKMVYVQGNYSSSGVIGYGPYTPSGWQGGYLDTEIKAARVAAGMAANYTMNIVCFNKGNSEIFLQTKNGDWYLIDLDGHIIEAHVTGVSPAGGAVLGMSIGSYPSGSSYCAAVDMSVRRLTTTYSLGVTVYSIGLDGTLTVITGMVTTIGRHDVGYAVSVYMDGNIIVLAERQSLQVIVYGAISAAPITLGEIVETECLSSNLLTAGDLDVSELTDVVRGYQVTNPGAIRAALEPLRQAWPFDVVPSGYKLKFPKRGKSSVLTIPAENLVLSGNSDVLTVAREMDTQLPRRIEVAYADVDREYDQSKQRSERLNTDAINETQVELAIVMSATEAAQKAEILLYAAWLERADLSFILPPIYAQLEPADIVTIVTAQATYEVRIASINYLPDGRLECSGKPNAAATYTSSAVGQAGVYTGQQMTLPGPAELLLLDIPCVNPTYMDKPGLLTGMSPYLDAWKGGAIVRSDDAGQTWEVVDAIAPPGSIAGVTTSQLAAGVTHIVDTANVLDVIVHGGTLVSVTDSALFNGANHFAIGAHGRWEIVGVKTAATLAGNQYRLSNLMRGRFGTEWAMSLHTAADTIVLLDAATLRFISLNPSAINAERLWRGVMKGQSIDAAAETALTYSAVNLKPLAPIRLRGHANPGSFDWTIEWERRSRTPVEPFSGVATPLGETSEAYEVEIWDATYTTLKRTLTGITSKSATWTSAQQVADFGSYQTEVYARVYQLSPTVGRSAALQGYLQHNVLTDQLFSNVVLLMHMNGASGGTTFTDEKGKSVTVFGNAQTSTAQSKFSGSSCKLDGTGDYLGLAASSDFDFGSGDFTWECWIYQIAVMTGTYADAIWCSQVNPVGFAVGINSDGKIGICVDSSAGAAWDVRKGVDPGDPRGSIVIPLNTWTHIAVSRSGSTWYGFVNGVVDQTFTSSATLTSAPNGYFIGHWHDANARCFNGHIAEVRVTKGACRYNGAFTPPTAPFQNA